MTDMFEGRGFNLDGGDADSAAGEDPHHTAHGGQTDEKALEDLFRHGDTDIKSPLQALLPPGESTFCLGHEAVEALLLSEYEAGKTPHAMIFSGPSGIGKTTFAYRLVRFLLSHKQPHASSAHAYKEAPPSGDKILSVPMDTGVVSRLAAGGHPDFRFIDLPADERTGKTRTTHNLDEIREIPSFMRLTPAEGGWRIALINEAHQMNRFAQNALLKILEEPPANSLLILLTQSANALIPTIRSRSRIYHFSPLTAGNMDYLLGLAQSPPDRKDRDFICSISEGSIGFALTFHEAGGIDITAGLLDTLGSWPVYEWKKIYDFAATITRKNSDDSYFCFKAALLWIIYAMVQHKAKGRTFEQLTAYTRLDLTSVQRLWRTFSLNQLIILYDRISEQFDNIEIYHLDKRQGILNLYAMLAEGADVNGI